MADAQTESAALPATALFEDLSQTAPDGTLTKTNNTTDVGAAPDGTVQKFKKTKIIKRKRRPARPQQDPATFKTEPPPQTGTIFNM